MKNKKVLLLNIITISTIVAFVVGATYAYFTAQGGDPTSANLNVTTYTTDVFTFTTGSDIKIYADQSTFASGKGNATGSTFARATLTANNKTNIATDHYNVYFNIENNTFEYSIDESTPELILTVTDSAGAEVTDISGLTHTSVTDGSGASISGYDITDKSGLITLFNNREITASPSKEETWNIKLTFVNYNKDQNKNTGKALNAKIKIQKEKEIITVANICKNGQSLSSCIIAMNGIDDTLYHHDGTLTNGITDGSYRYAGANPNNYVCFGSASTPCPTDNLYRIIGVFGDQVKLIKYDYANSNLLGTDGDYADTNLISDIGLEATYKGELTTIDTYYWNNTTKTNTWSESELNKTNLNTNFINNIGTEWANKIATTTWKVGGNTSLNISAEIPSVAYQNEIKNPSTIASTGETEYRAKIGLMYVTDYGYSANPSTWTLTMGNYDNTTSISINWMHMGSLEWTISRVANRSGYAFNIDNSGYVEDFDVDYNIITVRPSFSLLSSTTYKLGQGTAADPIAIN